MNKEGTFIRFLVVGVINTIIGTSVMFIAYNAFGFSYWISSLLNYCIGSIVSYLLNKYYTFRQKEKSLREVVHFVLNIAICYFIAYYLAAELVQYILASYSQVVIDNGSMAVGMVLFVLFNYLGQRLFVFRKKQDEIKIPTAGVEDDN